MSEIVTINGRRYEVLEWSCKEIDCDGEGTDRWELFCTEITSEDPE